MIWKSEIFALLTFVQVDFSKTQIIAISSGPSCARCWPTARHSVWSVRFSTLLDSVLRGDFSLAFQSNVTKTCGKLSLQVLCCGTPPESPLPLHNFTGNSHLTVYVFLITFITHPSDRQERWQKASGFSRQSFLCPPPMQGSISRLCRMMVVVVISSLPSSAIYFQASEGPFPSSLSYLLSLS